MFDRFKKKVPLLLVKNRDNIVEFQLSRYLYYIFNIIKHVVKNKKHSCNLKNIERKLQW